MTKKYDSIENKNNKKLIISIEYKNQNLKYTIRHLAALIILTNISFCVLSMPIVILQIMHHLNTQKYNRKKLFLRFINSDCRNFSIFKS